MRQLGTMAMRTFSDLGSLQSMSGSPRVPTSTRYLSLWKGHSPPLTLPVQTGAFFLPYPQPYFKPRLPEKSEARVV